MDVIKDMLDWLAATPAATLYYRDGLMHRHTKGRKVLSKAIPKGMREQPQEVDEMMILLLMTNPGMELQLLSKDPIPPYWIIYMNNPKNIELPKEMGMFIENGAICIKREDGKTLDIAVINP